VPRKTNLAKERQRAIMQNPKVLKGLGEIVAETGHVMTPETVLTGILLEAAETLKKMDSKKIEEWRAAGARFREELSRQVAERRDRKTRGAQKDAQAGKSADKAGSGAAAEGKSSESA
jgi:hypothetical protein